jgi:hypothetical protein
VGVEALQPQRLFSQSSFPWQSHHLRHCACHPWHLCQPYIRQLRLDATPLLTVATAALEASLPLASAALLHLCTLAVASPPPLHLSPPSALSIAHPSAPS